MLMTYPVVTSISGEYDEDEEEMRVTLNYATYGPGVTRTWTKTKLMSPLDDVGDRLEGEIDDFMGYLSDFGMTFPSPP